MSRAFLGDPAAGEPVPCSAAPSGLDPFRPRVSPHDQLICLRLGWEFVARWAQFDPGMLQLSG